MIPARTARSPEDGRILVLTLGAVAVAVALVAVIATASAVYLDRKALLSLADATAAHAAAQVDADAYFGGDGTVVTDSGVQASARDFLARAPRSLTDAPHLRLASPTGASDATTAQVTLEATSRPAFLPWVLAPWSDGIPLRVTASASAPRARARHPL